MRPSDFPETNVVFGIPPGMGESQVTPIKGCEYVMRGGPLDGALICCVAWKPDESDIKNLVEGGLIYLHVVGGLAPHFISAVPFSDMLHYEKDPAGN